jgi:hypothetical protein
MIRTDLRFDAEPREEFVVGQEAVAVNVRATK